MEKRLFRTHTGILIYWWTSVGLTWIWAFLPSAWLCLGWWEIGITGWAAGQDGGTSQIKVNQTEVRQEMGLPVTLMIGCEWLTFHLFWQPMPAPQSSQLGTGVRNTWPWAIWTTAGEKYQDLGPGPPTRLYQKNRWLPYAGQNHAARGTGRERGTLQREKEGEEE